MMYMSGIGRFWGCAVRPGDTQEAGDLVPGGFMLSAGVAHCLQPLDCSKSGKFFESQTENAGPENRRKYQFAAGRKCAAELLAGLGAFNVQVGVNADRSPVWPAGFVGSITHTDSMLGVAVAAASELRGLGIDIEKVVSLKAAREIERVCLGRKEMQLRKGRGIERCLYASLCFSAKESLYKCLYPLVNQYFHYTDAAVTDIDPDTGKLCLELLTDLSGEFSAGLVLEGRYRFDGMQVYTSFELPALTQYC